MMKSFRLSRQQRIEIIRQMIAEELKVAAEKTAERDAVISEKRRQIEEKLGRPLVEVIKEVEIGKRPWSPEVEEWIGLLGPEDYDALLAR
jgi:outer membrane lipopolysaccharide assembly protein LptE/RlpB